MNNICWRCHLPLKLYPKINKSDPDNCFYCGYDQNILHVIYVKIEQKIHDRDGGNPKTWGGNDEYKKKTLHHHLDNAG